MSASVPQSISFDRLSLPVVAAPMFLVSGPDLVIGACRAGIIGTLPSLNARTPEIFEQWLIRIIDETKGSAPYAVNLIAHETNARFAGDLELCIKYKVPLIIVGLGDPAPVVEKAHAYGGQVWTDIASLRHARKAISRGVDGLVLLCAGAGGHCGWLNPFAFVEAVRQFYSGTVVLAGGIGHGRSIRAAQMMGADLVYMGTHFIAARESLADEDYRQALVDASADEVILSSAVTGIPGNFLKSSLEAAGLNINSKDGSLLSLSEKKVENKAWRDIWTVGQGVGSIDKVSGIAEIIADLKAQYAG